jgi:hypothetical protein
MFLEEFWKDENMTGGEERVMPFEVKYFWWLSIAVVVFWAAIDVFDTVKGLNQLSMVPIEFRNDALISIVVHAVLTIFIWEGIVLLAAWLAAFRQKGWGRYVFAAVILTRVAIPLIVGLYFYGLTTLWSSLTQIARSGPRTYVTIILLLSAMFFGFSVPARRWFRDRMLRN